MILQDVPGLNSLSAVDPGLFRVPTIPSFPSSSSVTPGRIPVQRTGASIISTPTGSLQGLICTPEEKAK